MLDYYKQCVLGQFEAALWMFNDCIQKCPPQHWCGPTAIIGKYEFWHVAHHTMACTDYYLSPSEAVYELNPEFFPGGRPDAEDEYPSRQFEQREILAFVQFCLAKLHTSIAAETQQTIISHCGFPHHAKITRGEIYLYNMRHIMHHTGQLSAHLRRLKLDEQHQPKWKSMGWQA